MGFLSDIGKVVGAGFLLGGVGGALLAPIIAGPLLAAEAQATAQKKAQRAQEEANAIQRATANFEQARRRRAVAAQARIARAENTAQAIATGGQGGTGSSVFQGAQGAISTQAASNLSSLGRTFATQQATFDLRQQAQRELERGQRRAQTFQAITDVGMTGINLGLRAFA